MSSDNIQNSKLELAELHKLDDGLLAHVFAQNLKFVISDLNDRPNDNRPRKIKIEFTLVPEAIGGDLDRVKFDYKVANNLAAHEGRRCILSPKRLGKDLHLVFANLGTDARQPHLPLDEDT